MKFVLCSLIVIVATLHYFLRPAAAKRLTKYNVEMPHFNSTEEQRVLDFATEKILEGNRTENLEKVIETRKIATRVSQHMSGTIRFDYYFRLAETRCQRLDQSNVTDAANCRVLRCGTIEECGVSVYVKIPENSFVDTQHNCRVETKPDYCDDLLREQFEAGRTTTEENNY